MSPLTKLFVVLLVVLSLLLSAATIVFVNQTEDFKKTNQTQKEQLDAARNQANSANDALAASKQVSEAAIRQANAQVEAAKNSLNQLQSNLANKDTDLARANAKIDLDNVSVTKLTSTLAGSEDAQPPSGAGE